MPREKSKNLPAKKIDSDKLFSNKEYETTLADLKKYIRSSQIKAAVVVNKKLIKLYRELDQLMLLWVGSFA